MPDLSHEKAIGGLVAGIDEAGRGPWAGPVVAASVILPDNNIPQGINDSKKLSIKKRDALFEALQATAIIGIGSASVEEIDATNILAATKRAMQRAYSAMGVKADAVLIDGNQRVELPCNTVKTLVRGDSVSLSIAAASIIAKVTRDRIMMDLAKVFPAYRWESNKGYGTKQHGDALQQYGVTEHHRKSFKPVHQAIL